MGVWIETSLYFDLFLSSGSHPAWVCGLKLALVILVIIFVVTPCVGVWIETSLGLIVIVDSISHTLRGCVD